MNHKVHDIGVAKHIGRYSDAIESTVGLRWLHTSGTRPEHVVPYLKVRSKVLGDVRAAGLLLVVSQLIRPEVLVEA
jgi:hypothetical protein